MTVAVEIQKQDLIIEDQIEDQRVNVTGLGRKKKTLRNCLPKTFVKVLQALVCGTGVKATLIYSSKDNGRYTMRLEGPWQDLLKKCVRQASHVRSSTMYPCNDEVNLEGIDAWPSVLLKMQFAADVDEEEDDCHAEVTRKCPGISPRFLVGMTVGGVRLGFMEYLENCVSLTDVYKEKGPALSQTIAAASQLVQRLWLDAGILHGDLHTENVLVSRDTGAVYLIDYGMSIRMGDTMREALNDSIASEDTRPAKAYDEICKDFAYRTLLKRGYEIDIDDEEWNDDGNFMRLLRTYARKAAL